ncbi:MAG: hypothetical protein NC132_00280 [Corallococcus sp.]|nr:hypothetical protein [Corallococcus sp.]MCM1359161.1 hypothetical protein [Corallococcus sp.]MCM1394551.1 hypothetical protein [Corallococcus sp.]
MNHLNLRKFAIEHAREEDEVDVTYVYSNDNSARLKIEKGDGFVKVQKQCYVLNQDATIDFPADIDNNPYELLGRYENCEGGPSVFDNVQQAINCCGFY